MPNKQQQWLAVLIILFAFGLRVYNQAHLNFWSDEAVSLQESGAANVVDAIYHNEGMPILYFGLLHFWLPLTNSEIGVRLISLWLGAVGVALAIQLGFRYFKSQAGLWFGVIIAGSSLFILLSQWARPYSLAICLTLSLLILALRLGRPSVGLRHWLLFWLFGTLAMYTLYTLGFVLIGVGAYLAYKRYPLGLRAGWGPLALASAGIGLAFAPWVPIVLHQSSWAIKALWWITPPQPRLLLETMDQFLLSSELKGWPKIITLLIVPVAIVALVWGGYRAAKMHRLAFAILTSGLPLAIFWLLSYRSPLYVPRHAFFIMPGLALFMVETLVILKRPIQLVTGLALVAASLLAQLTPTPASGLDIPWDQVSNYLAQNAQAGDLVIFSPPFQRPAFEIKYQGPALDLEGIGDYEAYTHRPDAVFDVRVPLARAKSWATGHSSFWLIEDSRWPVQWPGWNLKQLREMKYEGVTVYEYQTPAP